jgi:polyhydroxyalkanoate synthesis regulator phasin
VIDSLRTYVTLVTGVTEATAAKAKEVASGLLDQGFARFSGTESVQALADDVLSASEANRAKLVELIRSEIDKAAARMGFVREDELAALRARVERLERGSTETAAPEAPTAPKKRKVVVEEGA